MQRIIKNGNSNSELTMTQRKTLFNNNKKKFVEDKTLTLEKLHDCLGQDKKIKIIKEIKEFCRKLYEKYRNIKIK